MNTKSSHQQKLLGTVCALPVLYVVLSGPVGGLICWRAAQTVMTARHYTTLQYYHWHMKFYSPLVWVADQIGLGSALSAYWNLCGWQFVFTA